MSKTESPTGSFLLSVVIRCRNEGKALRKLFHVLAHQDCGFDFETIVVDNDSVDDTRAVAEGFGARVVNIPSSEFSYGRAINIGFQSAKGQIVLLLSSHVLPLGRDFLSRCVMPFDDPKIDAARCISVDLINDVELCYLSRSYSGFVEPNLDSLLASDDHCVYPAATCGVYRKSTWAVTTFNEELEGAEDVEWASRVISAGGSIFCFAEAFYVYTRKRTTLEKIRRQHYLRAGMYRLNGRPSLTWSGFFWKVALSIGASPYIAARHVALTILKNWGLVTLPWKVRSRFRAGSLSEFELPNKSDLG